jgi:hypothetical protein
VVGAKLDGLRWGFYLGVGFHPRRAREPIAAVTGGVVDWLWLTGCEQQQHGGDKYPHRNIYRLTKSIIPSYRYRMDFAVGKIITIILRWMSLAITIMVMVSVVVALILPPLAFVPLAVILTGFLAIEPLVESGRGTWPSRRLGASSELWLVWQWLMRRKFVIARSTDTGLNELAAECGGKTRPFLGGRDNGLNNGLFVFRSKEDLHFFRLAGNYTHFMIVNPKVSLLALLPMWPSRRNHRQYRYPLSFDTKGRELNWSGSTIWDGEFDLVIPVWTPSAWW